MRLSADVDVTHRAATLDAGCARASRYETGTRLGGHGRDDRSYQWHCDNRGEAEGSHQLSPVNSSNDESWRWGYLFLQQIVFGELINCKPNEFFVDYSSQIAGQGAARI